MAKKNLLIAILSALVLIGFAGAALAGEGDYPPLNSGMTSSSTVSTNGNDAANCGRAHAQEGLTVQECLSRCS